MRRHIRAATLMLVVSWLIGCSNDYVPKAPPATGAPAAKPAPPSSSASSFSPRPSAQQSPERIAAKASAVRSATESPPSTKPVVTDPPTRAPDQYSVRLSMGVALPQTGPQGTLMSFSVEYVAAVSDSHSADYVWVIERAHGARNKRSIRLDKEGTLAILINGWHPTDGPFETHIESGSGSRLSRSIELIGP